MPKSRVIYAVDWLDAQRWAEWMDESEAEAKEPPLCTTVGVIVSKTKKRLVLAATIGHGSDSEVGEVLVIPAGFIKAIEPLGEVLIESDPTQPAKIKKGSRSSH